MPFSSEKIKSKPPKNELPVMVNVNKQETDNFINDVMKVASQLRSSHREKNKFKALFLKSFLLSFFLLCLGLFFLYTTYYFIHHAVLHKQENCRPLS